MNEGDAGIQTAGRPTGLIERPRLRRLLDETSAHRILLIAPAGYGKTTLARQWLTSPSRKAVWYRASASSADVAVLAANLARAATKELGLECEHIHQRLRTSSSPNDEPSVLGHVLAQDLGDWPAETWLVLDDYQTIAESKPVERFVEALLDEAPLRVLVTGRARPQWVSTRDILYGDVFEIGQSALAMTHGEAAAALERSSNSEHLAGLVALAGGWPAVIGLASLTSSSYDMSRGDVPEALYDFFAEELYRELDHRSRQDVCQLALASTINARLCSALFGTRGRAVLMEAERRGFLTGDEQQFDLHPLLRNFLLMKLTELDPGAAISAASKICAWEIDEGNWDGALELADRLHLTDVVLEVLERSLDDMLASGRIASVEQWLKIARGHDPTALVTLLAQMEICFRRHEWDQARSAAMRLVSDLPTEHPFLSRALHRIGQIGHLDDHYEEAVSFLSAAQRAATNSRDLRTALWSRFIAVSDNGDQQEARNILADLNAVPDGSADDLLRLSQAQLHLAARWGGVEQELKTQSAALALLDHSSDPLVRTGFLQTYGTAVVLAAKYEEAMTVAERQLEEAERSGLEWVTTHALELQGAALWGLREFEAASHSLREAYRLAGVQSDLHARVNAAVLLARTYLAQGAPERALETTVLRLERDPGPTLQGDFLSARALAYACSGDFEMASQQAAASERCTDQIEARVVRLFAQAICFEGKRGGTNLENAVLANAFRETRRTENYDAFVLAYRSYPAILEALSKLTGADARACIAHIPVSDRRLASRAGLKLEEPDREPNSNPLTPREEEVVGLIRNGLTNREIARTLWIEETTAKAHVRNASRKLGARSRTEAVVLFDQLRKFALSPAGRDSGARDLA
jgi:DNA-binding CsgD family transcriptional regulator